MRFARCQVPDLRRQEGKMSKVILEVVVGEELHFHLDVEQEDVGIAKSCKRVGYEGRSSYSNYIDELKDDCSPQEIIEQLEKCAQGKGLTGYEIKYGVRNG